MAKRLVLMYPKLGIYDTIIKDLPLSLLYAAAVVHDKGYEVKIIDQRVEADWKEKLLLELSKNPLCVGISTMTGTPIKFALGLSEVVKANSNVPVVWGGMHPTIMPEQTLEDEFVDIVVRGEGEVTFYELAEALLQKNSLRDVKGLSYKENGKIIHNPCRDQVDLETLPDLPYDLIDISNYYRKGYEERIVSVMTSRGCPHNCAFCYSPAISGRKWRKLSIEKAMKSLEQVIDKFNPGFICLLDDDFFIDPKRAKNILSEIKKKNWQVKFDFRGVRVDDLYRMDEEMLSLLEDIGTRNLHIGAESGSERILKLMRKGIQVQQTIDANQKLSKFPKLVPTYNFFSGLPTETEEDIFKSTDLIFQLLKENPHCHMTLFNQFTPYPGSELFDISVAHGYKPPASLRHWAEFGPENCANSLPWLNKKMVRLLDTLYLTSFFIDKKLDIHFASKSVPFKLLKLVLKAYRPIARLRFKNHFTAFPLEIYAMKAFFAYLRRGLDKEPEGYFENRLAFDKNRAGVWMEIARYLGRSIPQDSKLLDLGAGYCDFVNNVKVKEKFALDLFSEIEKYANSDVKIMKQSATEKIPLASDYLDVVFASNFFEHLNESEFAKVLREIRRVLRKNGKLIIIQPNYRFYRENYFDDPTHKQIFTDLSLAEILSKEGFRVEERIPRFLPATFKSSIPKSPYLVRLYLHSPMKPLAKQFLIVAGNAKEG